MTQYTDTNKQGLTYFTDGKHLVCIPYSVENLHRMAEDLGLPKCHYDNRRPKKGTKRKGRGHPHYDLPKKYRDHILRRVLLVSRKDIVRIYQGGTPKDYNA